jgi:hypothetical protein
VRQRSKALRALLRYEEEQEAKTEEDEDEDEDIT